MKENNIDKLFKANASKGNFSADDAHWATAEKMLDAQRKGGGFSFKIMSALAVTATMLTASLVWLNTKPAPDEDSSLPEMVIQNKAAQPATQQLNQTQSQAAHQFNANTKPTKKANPEQNDIAHEHAITKTPNNGLDADNHTQENLVTSVSASNSAHQPKQTATQNPIPGEDQSKAMADDGSLSSAPAIADANHDQTQAKKALNSEELSSTKTPDLLREEENQRGITSTSALAAASTPAIKSKAENNTGLEAKGAVPPTETAVKTQAQQEAANSEEFTIAKDDAQEEETQPASINAPHESAELATTTPLSEEDENGSGEDEDVEPFKWTDNFTYSIGGEFGYFFNQRQLSANPGYQHFRDAYETQNGSFSAGLSMQVGYRNWTLNSGIQQYIIREDVQYPTVVPTEQIDDNSYWAVYPVWSHRVDSTWEIRGINQGGWRIDTVWSVRDDSTFVTQIDTSTVLEENQKLAQNNGLKTMTYVEVPVLFGRSFKQNKVVVDLQAGVALGFLTRVEGARYINLPTTDLSATNQLDQFNNVLYSGILRVGVRYGLGKNVEVGLYPSLRYTFNSALKADFGKQRYLGYGVQFGLYYRL